LTEIEDDNVLDDHPSNKDEVECVWLGGFYCVRYGQLHMNRCEKADEQVDFKGKNL